MKLLAKDLSTGQNQALTNIDVLASGKMTTADVFGGIGLALTSQSSRPANVTKGLWLNVSNNLRFYNGTSDYEVAHSGTALAGDVTGTLGATVVGDDSHNHSNSTLSGVPGAGIDTTALHSGDSTGGDVSGTYPTNLTVAKLQGRNVSSGAPSNGQVLAWNNSLSQWEPTTSLSPGASNTGDLLYYNGASWAAAGLAPGGGQTEIFFWNNQTPSLFVFSGAGQIPFYDGASSISGFAPSVTGGIPYWDLLGTTYQEWAPSSPGELPYLNLAGTALAGYAPTNANDLMVWTGSGYSGLGGTSGNPLGTTFSTNFSAYDAVATLTSQLVGTMLRLGVNTASAPGASAGDLWVDSVTDPMGADRLYRYDAAGGGIALILDANVTFAGDVTGTYSNLQVTNDSHNHTASTLTLGSIKTLSDVNAAMSPSTNDVLYWTGSQWDATAPSGWGGSYFTVLTSSANEAAVNSALSTYSVVYLAPGTYSFTTTAITVPSGKRLVGLGSYIGAVQLQWSGSPTSRHLLLQNGTIENLYISLTGAAHTTAAVEGDSSSRHNYVKNVYVTAATQVASVYGFTGYFGGMNGWSVERMNGLNLLGTVSTPLTNPGLAIFEDFYIYAAPTDGVVMTTITDAVLRDGVIDCNAGDTTTGVTATNNTRLKFENIMVYHPGTTGLNTYTSGDDVTLRDIRIFGLNATTQYGIVLTAQRNVVVDGCYVEYCSVGGEGKGGMYIAGSSYDVHISNFTSYYCSGVSTSGIYIQSGVTRVTISNHTSYADYRSIWAATGSTYVVGTNCIGYDTGSSSFALYSTYSTWTNLYSYSAAAIGVLLAGDYSTYRGIFSYQASSNGISGTSLNDCTLSDLVSYDAGSSGLAFSACSESSFSNLYSYSSNGFGVYFANVYRSTVVGAHSRLSAGHGVVFSSCFDTSYSSISSYDDGDAVNEHGIMVSGCYYCSFSSLTANSAFHYGIYFNSVDYCSATGLTAVSCGSYGIVGDANCDWLNISTVVAYNNTTYDLYFPASGGANNLVHGAIYGSGKSSVHADWNPSQFVAA